MYCKSFNVFVNKILLVFMIGLFVLLSFSAPSLHAFWAVANGHDAGLTRSDTASFTIGTSETTDGPLSPDPAEEELPAALRSSCEAFGNPVQLGGRTRNKTVSRTAETASPYSAYDALCSSSAGVLLYRPDDVYVKSFSNSITTRKLE